MLPNDDGVGRGQVILIGGITIAVALVALAVVLNAAAFTGELATRHSAVGESDAVGYQHSAVRGVGGVIFYSNYYDYTDRSSLYGNVSRRAERWSRRASGHYATYRVGATADPTDVTNGSYVYQDDRGTFVDAGGASDWTLATGVDGTRRFTLNVTRDALVEPSSTDTVADLTTAGTFHVTLDNGTETASVFVYEEGDRVTVRVEAPDGGLVPGACSATGDRVTVDVTEGLVGATDCAPLSPPLVTGEYELRYDDGDAVAGRYGLVVDVPIDELRTTPYGPGTGGADPHAVPAVYAVTLKVTYATEELEYTTIERVAPEDTPRGQVYGVHVAARELVFVDPDGWLHSIARDGTVTTYDASSVQAVGPKNADLDGDDRHEVPYVDSSGTLKTVDGANETRTAATSAAESKTLLGVGAWGNATFDTRTAVFYVNTTDDTIHRAWFDEATGDYETQLVRRADGDGDGIGAVVGIADYNGDGDADIVFADGSQHVTYVDGGTTHETDEGVGQNNGIGAGVPHDFDNDGSLRAPIVDGSNNVALLPDSGTSEDLTSSGPAKKAPVAGIDWNTSVAGLEVVYVDSSSGTLHYVTLAGDQVQVLDASGDPVAADDDQGVA